MLAPVSLIRYALSIGTNQSPMESDEHMILQMLTLTAVPVVTFILTVLS